MLRCLCCNKEILNPTEAERNSSWHEKCVKSFFGVSSIPEIDLSEKELEKLADLSVNKGLTVPGVQKKLSLHLSKEDKKVRFTLVDYPTGYILKPQSREFQHLPEAEFAVMKMAEAAGIKTVPNALVRLQGEYAFITKRIDRVKGSLLAMEDFCQLSERQTEDKYRGSYENCGKIIKKYSKNVGLDMAEFYYRLLFCFLTGNSDMHLKNFSLIESGAGSREFSLAPAYDMLPVNLVMPEDKEETALTLSGKKRNLRKKDFLALATNLGISEKVADSLINKALKSKPALLEIAETSYFPPEMRDGLKQLIAARSSVF